ASGRPVDAVEVADVAEVEPDTCVVEIAPHLVLLELVAREDADLADVAGQQTAAHRPAEGTGATGDEHGRPRRRTRVAHGPASPGRPRVTQEPGCRGGSV